MLYIVVKCKCGRYFIKRIVYKYNKKTDKRFITVSCPYCGRRMRVNVWKLKKFPSIDAARQFMLRLTTNQI